MIVIALGNLLISQQVGACLLPLFGMYPGSSSGLGGGYQQPYNQQGNRIPQNSNGFSQPNGLNQLPLQNGMNQFPQNGGYGSNGYGNQGGFGR